MTQRSQVIPLKSQDRADSPSGQSASLPPILQSVRQAARKHILTLLEGLFNNTDDALFELADRSHNDSDQSMYFESMREIRLHRAEILQIFSDNLIESFNRLYASPRAAADVSEDLSFEDQIDEMTLVQNDDLEVTVAVSGIVSKVTSQFSLPIMQLTKRIDSICPNTKVSEQVNPLGPHQLSEGFVAATGCLDIDIKVRIILLKLFERFVMENLANCYEDTNSILAEAGILTDLKSMLRKPQPTIGHNPGGVSQEHVQANPGMSTAMESVGSGAPVSRSSMTGNSLHSPVIDASFESLQALLGTSHQGGEQGVPAYGNLVSTPQLMSILSDAQTRYTDSKIDPSQPPPAIDLRQLVLAQAERVTGASDATMHRNDEDTVNLVSMLFDCILNDRNLAIPMKALIGRLQIPVLKIAVTDKSFFSRSSHPARKLLNELSSAGIGWSSNTELKRDALYTKIESIVLRAMNNPDVDLALLEKLVLELRDFVARDTRRSMIVEQRVRETETGKARTQSAKETVQRLINQKASGLKLPPDISRFISDVWSKVLVYICVKQGPESSDWTVALETLDTLLWCVQPLDDMSALEARDREIPQLLEDISLGIALIGLNEAETQEQIDELQIIIDDVSTNDRAFLEDDSDHYVKEEQPPMEEIVLTSVDKDSELFSEAQPEPEFLEEINRLSEGTWVEMVLEDGARQRCKVAAIIEPGNRYVFVNRRGMKVVEKTRMGLAVELKRKTVTVLDESQVFDRALQAVIGNLRQMQNKPIITEDQSTL